MKELTCKVSLDIGANDGGFTHILLAHGFEVHLFEPVPDMFLECQKKYSEDRRVYLNNVGLSDSKGYLKDVTVHGAWAIGKDLNIAVVPEYKDVKFDMALITLDEYVELMGVEQIGFIKLDVDGYEFRVLRGAEKTLLRDHPPIMIELNEYIRTFGESIEEFIKYIFWLGYEIHSADGSYIARNWEDVKPYYPYHSSYDVFLIK